MNHDQENEGLRLRSLHLGTVGELQHGQLGENFDRILAQAVRDCHAAPRDKRKRKVTIELEVTPNAAPDPDDKTRIVCKRVGVVGRVRSSFPAPETDMIDVGLKVDHDGRITAFFAPGSPENYQQALLFGDDDDDA